MNTDSIWKQIIFVLCISSLSVSLRIFYSQFKVMVICVILSMSLYMYTFIIYTNAALPYVYITQSPHSYKVELDFLHVNVRYTISGLFPVKARTLGQRQAVVSVLAQFFRLVF